MFVNSRGRGDSHRGDRPQGGPVARDSHQWGIWTAMCGTSCGDSHEAWPSVDRGDSHQNGATRGQPLGTGQPLGQPSMWTQSLYSSQNRQVALHVLREALTESVARRVAAARRCPRFDFLRGTMSRIPQLTAQPKTNGPQLNRPAASAPFDEHVVANSRRL